MSATPNTSSGDLTNSTRAKTLTIAIVGILALAGAGALAGAVYDSDAPALIGSQLDAGGSGANIPAQRGPSVLPQVETTPVPTPTDDGFPAPSPTPEPTPTDGGGVPGGGTTVEVPAGPLQVFLPDGWGYETASDGSGLTSWSGQGDLVWMQVFQVDPSVTDAAGILAQNLNVALPPEVYTQLETSEVESQQPFGALVSLANIAYQGVVVDSQGSWPVFGNLWVGLRQDGKVLFLTADASPPEQFGNELWRPVVESAFGSFGNPQF